MPPPTRPTAAGGSTPSSPWGRGIKVGYHAVERLMRRAGLQGVTGRPKFRRGLRPEATAADLVQRQFTRASCAQLWGTDITEHPTREGKVYCAVVLDACPRRVVGWSIDATPTGALVTTALGMAIQSRKPAGGTLIHSDQGCSSPPGCSASGQGLRAGALHGRRRRLL
jgi:putative transposase